MWRVPKAWPGSTVFILGGGPSLKDIEVPRLKGRRVIACNNAFILAPWADVLCWADAAWYEWNWRDLHHHLGPYRVCWRRMPEMPGAASFERLFEFHKPLAISFDPTGVVGANTGHGALNLAVLFGASRVVLLGFDMKTRDGAHNWHNFHQRQPEGDPYRGFIAALEAAAPELVRAGVECFNASPDSALECFPKISFADALELPEAAAACSP